MISDDYALSRFGTPLDESAKIARKFNAANQGVTSRERLLTVAVAKDGIAYYLIARLGAGVYGETFTASVDARRRARYVVKMFIAQPDDKEELPATLLSRPHDYDFYLKDVEREYLVSAVLRRRLGGAFCEDNVVCSIERFYRVDYSRGYIVFPYFGSLTLTNYLATFVHARMRQYKLTVKRFGFSSLSTAEIQELTKRNDNTGANAHEMVKELRLIQLTCINLARQILMTVAKLHSVEIIHMDLKPDNILVADDIVRLIDFGIACVGSSLQDALFDVLERFVLVCPDTFMTTKMYEDPLAPTMVVADDEWRVHTFSKLEVYTLGKHLQVIFDPSTISDVGHQPEYPVVQSTVFMLPGLFELIFAMTGEQRYTPAGNQLTVTPQELASRQSLFQSRPTAAASLRIFTNLVSRWTQDAE